MNSWGLTGLAQGIPWESWPACHNSATTTPTCHHKAPALRSKETSLWLGARLEQPEETELGSWQTLS